MKIPTERQCEAYRRVKIMGQSYSQAGQQMGISKVAVYKLVKRLTLTCDKIAKFRAHKNLEKNMDGQTVNKRNYK